jgi:hypothetical protein
MTLEYWSSISSNTLASFTSPNFAVSGTPSFTILALLGLGPTGRRRSELSPAKGGIKNGKTDQGKEF